MSDTVKPLEEIDPELHDMLLDHCNKFANSFVYQTPYTSTESHKQHKPFVRTEVKINRNDPCPHCLAEGITIKFKKCQKHNI